jgi:hypothetical protein
LLSSGQHPRGQREKALIRTEQGGHLTASEHQVKAVVNGMIEVRGQGESLRLQGAIGLDVINKGCSTIKALLQTVSLELTSTLQAPKGISNLGRSLDDAHHG